MKNENPFKQKLYNHTMPVREEVWDHIAAELPGKTDQKKFPFFWMSLFTALILGGAIFVYATQLTPTINAENQTKELNTPADTPTPSLDNISIHHQSNHTISDQTVTTSIASSRIENSDNLLAQAYTSQSTNSTAIAGHQGRKSSVSSSTDPSLQTEASSLTSKDHFNTSYELTQLQLFRAGNKHYNFLPLADNMLIAEAEEITGIEKIKPDPSCYRFTGEEGRSNLSFDIFGGPGFSPRSFENISNEATLYAEARKATERHQYSYGAGARVNLNLTHEWAVRLGVLYEQTGDIFDYTDTLATQRSTRIDSFFAADGTFLYAETNTVLIFGTLIKKIHNRYHHLDIPLLASYEMPMGRATLMVNAGPVINLMTSFRGQILDAGLAPQHITQGEPNQLAAYKTNVGLSIYLGAGALFPITKHISGLVEPRFLYRIRPVTLDTYQLKEHRHFAGLNLGIRYHLQ